MPKLINTDVARALKLANVGQNEVNFRVISEPGAWASLSYALMEQEFDADLLDPKERLENWLLQTRADIHEFPFLWVVAYVNHNGEDYLLGTFDGNLMPVVDWTRHDKTMHAPLKQDGSCVFVVGRQATAKIVRDAGVKGVGRGLFNYSVDIGREQARARGWGLRYLVLESEERSKGFWRKMGFLWPSNTLYIQPPLEFDEENGNPLRQAVTETLLFRAVNSPQIENQFIEPAFVRDTIATIYTYWSLHPFRATMKNGDPSVVRAVEKLVMEELLGRVEQSLRDTALIPLVAPPC